MRLQLTMSKFSHKKSQKAQKVRAIAALWLIVVCVGCRRDMQDQPKIKPLRGSTFFTDGLGSRQPIEGTIPRGFLRADHEFYTGKKTKAPSATASPTPGTAQPGGGAQANTYPDDVDT